MVAEHRNFKILLDIMLKNKKIVSLVKDLLNKEEFKQKINDFDVIKSQSIHMISDINLPKEFSDFISKIDNTKYD